MLEIMNKESSKFFSQVADVTVVTEVFNHSPMIKINLVSSNFHFREPKLKIMKKLLQMATRQAINQSFYLIGLRRSDLLRFIFFFSLDLAIREQPETCTCVAVNNFRTQS